MSGCGTSATSQVADRIRFRCKSGHAANITAMTGFDPKRKSRMLAGCRHLCRKYLVSQINIAITRSAGGERVVVQAFRMADRARELLLVRRSKSLIRSPPPANSRWPTGGPPAYGRLRSR